MNRITTASMPSVLSGADVSVSVLPLQPVLPLPPVLPTAASDKKSNDDTGVKTAEALPLAAFGDALLVAANALLRDAGQESKASMVSAVVLPEKQEQRSTATARAEPASGVQQLLDIFLKAGKSAPLIDTVLAQAAVFAPEQIAGERVSELRTPQVNAKVTGEDLSQLALSARAPVPTVTQLQAAPQGLSSTLSPQPLKVQPNAALQPLMQMTETAGSAASHTELKADVHNTDHSANLINPSRSLKLEGGQERWSQQLQSALGERLQMQLKEQTQYATIRLDPPALGKIDISLQIENGRIQVHINASQGEVYRALNQVSNELRQSLTEQNFIQVNVQVSSQSGQQQRDRQQHTGDPEVILASEEITQGTQSKPLREDGSILLTV